jgi:hypothetical protein
MEVVAVAASWHDAAPVAVLKRAQANRAAVVVVVVVIV